MTYCALFCFNFFFSFFWTIVFTFCLIPRSKLFSSKSVTRPWTVVSSKILSVSSCSCSFFSWRRTQHPIFSSHTEPLSLNSSQRPLLVDLSFHVTVQNLRRWIIVFLQLGCIKSFEFCLHLMGVIFISISWFTSVILSGRHLSPPIHDCKLQTQS